MLLDDKDFLDEQSYHADKRRLLNRTLHGSGVVCGLDLNAKCGGQAIEVTPGLALDCCGNEIWVSHAVALDLSKLLPPKEPPKDKDCKEDGDEADEKRKSYYLGIRYQEKASDPDSVYLPGAGCEERTCEYSRYKEGFCLEIAECCRKKAEPGILKQFCECKEHCKPEEKKLHDCWQCQELKGTEEGKEKEGRDQQKEKERQMEYCRCLLLEEFCEQSVPCPDCCSSCCHPCHVILGRIDVDEKGCILEICINDCREYVITGPMVKHVIVSTFAGLDKGFFELTVGRKTKEIPDIESLAANPIKALCWYLRNFIVEKGCLTLLDTLSETCKAIFKIPKYATEQAQQAMAQQVNKQEKHQTEVTRQLLTFVPKGEHEKLRKELLERVDSLQKKLEEEIKKRPK